MRAGDLRRRLKIYRQTSTRTPTGAVQAGRWENVFTVWGQFVPLSVKDIIAGQAQETQITARAKIRYRTDIDGTMRVEHAGQMYEIVGEPLADNRTGREYLTLVLKGVSDDR